MALCTKCRKDRPVTEFHRKGTARRQSRCKQCQAEYQRQRLAKAEARAARPSFNRKYKYGMTDADFAARFAKQGNCCAICRGSDPGGRGTWAVDHDHACCAGAKSCGRCVRGILCTRCNVGLGMFRDSREALARALAYLEKSGIIATSS